MAAGMRKTSPMTIIAAKGIWASGGFVVGILVGGAVAPKQAILWVWAWGCSGSSFPASI